MMVQARVAWPRAGSTIAAALLAGAVVATWHSSRLGFEELATPTVDEIAARGEAIQQWTEPRDFIVYVVESDSGDWNTSFLYFAKRDGFNLPRPDLSAQNLTRIYLSYARRYPRFFVACPAHPRVLFRRLESWGLHLAAEGPSGRLYRMEQPALAREPGGPEQDSVGRAPPATAGSPSRTLQALRASYGCSDGQPCDADEVQAEHPLNVSP
jgi:hypothetical protein